MTSTIQILVLLLGVVAAVAALATRLRVPPAILLVLAGVVLAVIPGLPAGNSLHNWYCWWFCHPSSTRLQWQ